MTSHDIFMYIASIAFGLLLGALIARRTLRSTRLSRNADNTYRVRIPFLGGVTLGLDPRVGGLVIDEVFEIKERLGRFGKLLDTDLMLGYAKEYRINYVGTEGDRQDRSWSAGRLAYCTISSGCRGGYEVHLNPDLDLERVSLSLSRDLNEPIAPEEVYLFLFLHEVGHTAQAGNRDFYEAIVNYALSGGSRSSKRRRELKELKNDIERFADRFALRELARRRERPTD